MARAALPLLALALLALAAYATSFGGDFVFDDVGGVRDKALVHDLPALLRPGAIWREGRWAGYVTFALNHAIHRTSVVGYHVVNFAIHVVNALLVHALVTATFAAPRLRTSRVAPWAREIAFVAAALFVTHPLQTQAVTYVIQRFTSLAMLFYLLAVVLYARWRVAREDGPVPRAHTVLSWAGLLASAVLAMKTKEIAFTLPIAIAAYEWTFFEGRVRRRARYLAPVLATLPIVPLRYLPLGAPIADMVASAARTTQVQTDLPRADYLVTQLPVVASYLRLLVLPVGQNVDHDFPLQHAFASPLVLGSGALLAGLVALAVWLLRRTAAGAPRALDPAWRVAAYGIFWFFLALSVESVLVVIVDVMFEHRVYLPSAGLFAGAATALALLARSRGWSPRRFVVAGALVSILLAGASLARNRVWADELTLWTDAARKSPGKARPHLNRGVALVAAGRGQEALEAFAAGNRADPSNADVMSNMGALLRDLGRNEEAAAWLRAAIRARPDHADAYYNLGSVLLTTHAYAEAAAMFEQAVARQPDYPNAYANWAAALNQLGRPGEAIARLEPVAASLAGNADARFNLGVAYALVGNLDAARREADALRLLAPARAVELSRFLDRAPAPAR